ncbi:MAG: HAD family phosphatase [Eubacteriales bacterium]|nr:HAD family phosphatase [Eubacteriales bacterium]
MKDLMRAIQNGSFKAAVFDIDGTLIDSMPIWEDLDAEFLKTQGIELSEQEKQELNATMWTMTVDEGVKYLKETFHLSLTEEEISQALADVIEHFYVYEVPAKPGMPELVQALHDAGVPMALATVGAPAHETAALKRLGLLDYFESMFDCNSLGTTKREAVIYETAAHALLGGDAAGVSFPAGVSRADVLVVEDVLHALTAAKQAGFTTVAVEDAASAKDKPRILEVSDFYIKKDQ